MNPEAASLLEALVPFSGPCGDPWFRLRAMLEEHGDTAFGRAFGFHSIRSSGDFREAVPPMDYEEHRSWIERAAAGECGVLACGDVLGFERTSGTSSRSKWIPITDGLRREFACGLASWFGGWKRRCPEVFEGRAYWALSPPGMTPERTKGGLTVGMTGDAAYFPDEIGACLAEWLVVPDLGGDPREVFDRTAEALLAVPDLSVVSVWSPTFLLGIDASLRRMRNGFCWKHTWPGLALVSCWADASSAAWIPKLRERLGGIPIEAKGLLATEGITTIPDAVDGSPRLAGECHWHEFLDDDGGFVEVPDLRMGRTYEVLLTTAGGLYRYRGGDRVELTGMGSDGLPRLRFIGRAGSLSDLVGEKLHENQVAEALAGRGFMVADPEGPGYDLWMEDVAEVPDVLRILRMNPYFDQALTLGQLAPVRVHRLRDDWNIRLATALAEHRGCRIGDVKPSVLMTRIRPEEVASWLD